MVSEWSVLIPLFLLLMGACMGCSEDIYSPSRTLYHNGTIYSMDDQNQKFTSMLVEDGKIIQLGGEQLKDQLGNEPYQSFDLEGRFVFPGLIEGHGHFLSLGEVVCGLDISGLNSWEEVLDRTVEFARELPDTSWIIGKGWHPNHWVTLPENTTEGYPNHAELSRLFPDQPVILQHSSFHALLANKKALEIAGVTTGTPDPVGGRIIRFEDGSPSGILEENAMGLVMDHYWDWKNNRPMEEKIQEQFMFLDSASRHCLSFGITTFVDAGIGFREFQILQQYQEDQGLNLRLWAMASGPQLLEGAFDSLVPYQSENHRLFVQAAKAFVDGALGSNGAWMLEEYLDQPGWTGQNVTDLEKLEAIGQKCLDLGLQYCVHAIGDRANRQVLDIFQKLFEKNQQDGQDLRWRIEHAQIVQPTDFGRFGQIGVIPSMQAIHCASDAPMVIPKIGSTLAREGAYPWRALIDHGSVIANGTDTPVERVNPFENLYASVTRKASPDGKAFFQEQAMTRGEAMKSLTLWNAFATKMDPFIGSLEIGKWADFFIVDTDLLYCDSAKILEAQVLRTYVDGRMVWSQ